ncbi:MAG: hypothetical protein E6J90_22105 [Deltaproteobacteria bacterium]|nr:MAG: hypothetical protein E6J90_22105 [Deltaproteobacteria bacterium]TMQ21212.1 MAG: hypothetical protein E6J91_02805 [Deltaproteobacteria bacterium]
MSSGAFGAPDVQHKRGFVVSGLGVVGVHGAAGGGGIGVELAGGGAWAGGLYLGVHSRAFGGDR